MAGGGGVHLLLQHPLVHRADGPFRPAVDPAPDLLRGAEGVLGDRAAVRAPDLLRAQGDLVFPVRLAPLLRPVGVADRHPADGDRVVDAGDRRHSGQPPAGADDHLAVDLLAQDPVRAAHVLGALGGDRRRLQAEPRLRERPRGLVHDAVLRGPPVLQREVEAAQLQRQPDHLRVNHVQRLLEQLLAGLVALEDDYLQRLHSADPDRALPAGGDHVQGDRASRTGGRGRPASTVRGLSLQGTKATLAAPASTRRAVCTGP